MAITDAEMRDWYSRVLITALRQANIMVALCDRQWQAQARTGETVNIYLDEGDPDAANYTHGNRWAAATDDTDVAITEHKLDRYREINTLISKKAARNLPFNIVTQQAENLGENIAKEIDQWIIDKVKEAALATGNHVGEFGASTGYLDGNANPAGDGPMANYTELIWKPLRAIRRRCQAINLTGKAARMQSRMYIIMDTVFDDALSEYLRTSGGADALAYEQVTGRGPDMMNGYRGTIWNQFDLFVTNSDTGKNYGSPAKAHDFIFAGNSGSIAYSEADPQVDYWPPEGSPFGPFHQFNGLFEYGATLTKNDRIVSAAIRRAA